jgi:hypothetical protein
MRMTRRRRGQSLREGKPGTDTLRGSWTPEGSPTTRTSSLADIVPCCSTGSAQTLGRWPSCKEEPMKWRVKATDPGPVSRAGSRNREGARTTSGRLRLPTGMLCRGAASSIRSERSDCSSGSEAAESPRATDCRRVERPGTSGAPSLRESRCCRHPAKPGGSTGGTSGLPKAWLPLPALTATAGTDPTCGSAAGGHVLTQPTAARERLAASSRFRWASARSRRSCLVMVPHGYLYDYNSTLGQYESRPGRGPSSTLSRPGCPGRRLEGIGGVPPDAGEAAAIPGVAPRPLDS